MLVRDIFFEADYTTFRGGNSYIRIGVWYNAHTGKMIDAHYKNHAELVATEPQRFGIRRAEISAIRKQDDFDSEDWNEPVIKLANAHGWVRVKAEGKPTSLELNLQSCVPADALKAARHFVDELSPATIFVDLEVRDHDNVWHTKLEGAAIDRYLKTGRLPA